MEAAAIAAMWNANLSDPREGIPEEPNNTWIEGDHEVDNDVNITGRWSIDIRSEEGNGPQYIYEDILNGDANNDENGDQKTDSIEEQGAKTSEDQGAGEARGWDHWELIYY